MGASLNMGTSRISTASLKQLPESDEINRLRQSTRTLPLQREKGPPVPCFASVPEDGVVGTTSDSLGEVLLPNEPFHGRASAIGSALLGRHRKDCSALPSRDLAAGTHVQPLRHCCHLATQGTHTALR